VSDLKNIEAITSKVEQEVTKKYLAFNNNRVVEQGLLNF